MENRRTVQLCDFVFAFHPAPEFRSPKTKTAVFMLSNSKKERPRRSLGRPHILTTTFGYSTEPSCSATTGVSVPKSPWDSWSGPAVKNSVVDGPAAAPLPNVRDQRPSMVTSELSGFFTKPSNL